MYMCAYISIDLYMHIVQKVGEGTTRIFLPRLLLYVSYVYIFILMCVFMIFCICTFRARKMTDGTTRLMTKLLLYMYMYIFV